MVDTNILLLPDVSHILWTPNNHFLLYFKSFSATRVLKTNVFWGYNLFTTLFQHCKHIRLLKIWTQLVSKSIHFSQYTDDPLIKMFKALWGLFLCSGSNLGTFFSILRIFTHNKSKNITTNSDSSWCEFS